MTFNRFFCLLMFLPSFAGISQLSVLEVGNLPEAVSNNAQCEGFVGGVPYLYSFGGIDPTKSYSGIHLRSFRYNAQTNSATQLPDLPDTLGKIAAAANRIGDTIYITGGYHVFSNGNELSSSKMHKFNTQTNTFMADGPDIPQATDDHVQVVWRDSLLILITGWKNTTNIANVQIYNPSTNLWSAGTPIPNNHTYKSFGASGLVLGDTIYYFGGARSTFGFTIQNALRKGVINPLDPTQIDWSFEVIDPLVVGYRMAATTVGQTLHWLGGSEVTYNYNGIAYNNSGGVPPSNRDLYTHSDFTNWQTQLISELPMDLRGLADINDSVKYIAGGMISNQTVTDKVYKLTWDLAFLDHFDHGPEFGFKLYPQPFTGQLKINLNANDNAPVELHIHDLTGRLMNSELIVESGQIINTNHLPIGVFMATVHSNGRTYHTKIIKSRD